MTGIQLLGFFVCLFKTTELPVILPAMLFLSTAVKIQFNLQLKNPRYKERLYLLSN